MDAVESIKSLTCKNFVYFFKSGDDAIFFLLSYLKNKGFNKVLIPDMGGWFSYKKFPKKLGIDVVQIKTDDGLVDLNDLALKISSNSFVLINSLGGYFVDEPMVDIERICKDNNVLLINDVSGSIGTGDAFYGDFCVGSFGNDKPIDIGYGGFLGCNAAIAMPDSPMASPEGLADAISILKEKLLFWKIIRRDVMKDLDSYDILHKDSDGINIVAAFNTDTEKESLINYCQAHNLEFVNCPSYIKVERPAISIEVKRRKYY